MNGFFKAFLGTGLCFLFFSKENLAFKINASELCSFQKGEIKKAAKTTVATPEENDYDVEYVKMDLQVSNTSAAISGSVLTRARIVAASMSDYYFELSDQLSVDSAKLNGIPVSVTQVNNFVRKIMLPVPLVQNTVFEAEIFYQGIPSGGSGFFTNGVLNQADNSIPVQVTHTVSAAYHSRDWWPCKQSLTDKIDSADIRITVPNGLKVASNGLLTNTTPIGATHQRFEWSTRYPTDYYLLSFAVAPYQEYHYYMHFSGSSDSMLVQNFIYDHPSILAQHQGKLDTIGHIINYFSDIFGKYPFDKEKAGICMAPLSGGMENQTMVTLGSLDFPLIAHELAHQWWGNSVTCRSMKDMWLNEGWATYSTELFVEKFYGAAMAKQQVRTPAYQSILMGLGGSVYVDDTTSEFRIYDGRLTYNKGAAVAHMLRYVMDNDSLFFQTLKAYHSQFRYGTATTEDLKSLAEQISGQSLDTFFYQWVYQEGYPTYSAKWAQSGNQVIIKLTQTTSRPNSVPVFKMPVEIKLKSASADTVIRVFNSHNAEYFTIDWNEIMTGMEIDPGDHIVNKTGLIAQDAGISDIGNTSGKKPAEIFPNPSGTFWLVRHLQGKPKLILSDMNGKKIAEYLPDSGSVTIPAAPLAPGVYNLSVINKETVQTFQLIR